MIRCRWILFGIPSFLLEAKVEVDAVPQLLLETIPGASRAALASTLGHWLTDDVIAACRLRGTMRICC